MSAVLLTAALWTSIAKAQAADEAQVAEARPTDAPSTEEDEYYELMRVFVETFQEIDRQYVKEVDRRELVEAAIRGMLSELDPYSNYIDPKHLEQFTEAISQEFGGVGIRVNWDKDQRAIEVLSPLPGSPAYDAGILSGDRVVEIDGKLVADFTEGRELEEAIKLLRGKEGEPVTVGIKHINAEKVEQIKLVRDIIQLDTVMGYSYKDDGSWNFMLNDEKKIGYLRLTHFTNRSTAEIRAAMKELKKADLQGLILDLRNNPGGLLQAAVDISDMFIEEGEIVSTKGRNTLPRTWAAKRFGTFTGFPMAILINNYSASASEIVSACLQDHNRAIVIGQRSWGKGSVQNVIDLEGGESALKLTTASYHRPSGKNIHRFPNSKETDEWGVVPNDGYDVKFTLEELRNFQIDRQVRDNAKPGTTVDSDFVDTQLQKSIETITSELSKSKPDEKAADGTPAEQEAPVKQVEEKKAAFRIPFLKVEKLNVG